MMMVCSGDGDIGAVNYVDDGMLVTCNGEGYSHTANDGDVDANDDDIGGL